jgi:translation initiation factor 1A
MKKPQGRKPPSKKPLSAEEEEQQRLEMMRRTPLPRQNQVIGICEQRVGGSRMKVRCMDGKTRICRIPGRLKRRLWIREGDVLLIEPWELSADDKGDVVFKYRPIQVEFLKKKGHLKKLEVEEF